jgi:hypothetical protein
MFDNNIIAGVIHPYLFNEETLLEAHRDGAKLLILHSQAVDIERNEMFPRLLSKGLNMTHRPNSYTPKFLLEAIATLLEWNHA